MSRPPRALFILFVQLSLAYKSLNFIIQLTLAFEKLFIHQKKYIFWGKQNQCFIPQPEIIIFIYKNGLHYNNFDANTKVYMPQNDSLWKASKSHQIAILIRALQNVFWSILDSANQNECDAKTFLDNFCFNSVNSEK